MVGSPLVAESWCSSARLPFLVRWSRAAPEIPLVSGFTTKPRANAGGSWCSSVYRPGCRPTNANITVHIAKAISGFSGAGEIANRRNRKIHSAST